jgi:hypothetical protein
VKPDEFKLNENVTMPVAWGIGLIVACSGALVVIVSAALYVARIDGRAEAAHAKADGNSASIESISGNIETILLNTQSMDRRLSRIEGALNQKKERKND